MKYKLLPFEYFKLASNVSTDNQGQKVFNENVKASKIQAGLDIGTRHGNYHGGQVKFDAGTFPQKSSRSLLWAG